MAETVCALCGQTDGHSPRCSVTRHGVSEEDYRMERYEASPKPPPMALSAQMRVAIEMAAPEISGVAAMTEEKWLPEVERLEGAVEAERKRVAEYVRGRGADGWDPSVEAALRQVADEIERDYHHGGR